MVFILSIKRNIRKHRCCAFHALCIVLLLVVHLDLNFKFKIQKRLNLHFLFTISLSFSLGPPHLPFPFFLLVFSSPRSPTGSAPFSFPFPAPLSLFWAQLSAPAPLFPSLSRADRRGPPIRPFVLPPPDLDSDSSPARPRAVPAAIRLGPARLGAAAAPI
jgi:hypothetical protein